MDTNSSKNTSIITFPNHKWTCLSHLPPVSYSTVCVSQQSSRSKVPDSKRMGNILVFQLLLVFEFPSHKIHDAIFSKSGFWTRSLHQHKQLHVRNLHQIWKRTSDLSESTLGYAKSHAVCVYSTRYKTSMGQTWAHATG